MCMSLYTKKFRYIDLCNNIELKKSKINQIFKLPSQNSNPFKSTFLIPINNYFA